MHALIVWGSIIAYFAIGYWLAKRDIPNVWERVNSKSICDLFFDTRQGSVRFQATIMLLFWPIVRPIQGLNTAIHQKNPAELERKLKIAEENSRQQQKRIKELEDHYGLPSIPLHDDLE